MSEQEVYEKKKFWILVSAYYQKTLENIVVQMYAEDCKSVTCDQLKYAFDKWRKGPKGSFMPMPMQLISILEPENDPTAEANAVVALIFEAIKKYGYSQSQAAKEYIGEYGWECVKSFGGWYNLCTNDNLGGESTIRAQLREMAKSKYHRAQQGIYDKRPELPGSCEDNLKLKEIGSLVKIKAIE